MSLNLLEPSGPVQACNGIALPLPYKMNGTHIKIVCFDFLYNSCLKHLIVGRSVRDMIINVYWALGKVPVIHVRF